VSARLNVVVVQSPRMTSLQVGLVAEIVIQLLGRPGIDVAMVTSLEANESDSTDRLMLTSLENDVAVIDWRPIEQTIISLQTLGINATRAPHAFDPDAPIAPRGSRRIYAIDLRNGFKAGEVVEGLAALLRARQTVTVSLLSPREPKTTSTATVAVTSPNAKTDEPKPVANLVTSINLQPQATPSPTQVNVTPKPPASDATSSSATATSSRRPIADDAHLDALVDNLNGFDL
jgi:hypothetical protein